MTQKIIAYLDTNILLHYKQFNQIDWLKELEAAEVELVIMPVVIRELDSLKFRHHIRKFRDRSKSIIKLLSDLSSRNLPNSAIPISEKVHLSLVAIEPQINFTELGLDRTTGDDILIGSVYYDKRNGSAETVLVAADLGIRLKCQAFEIKSLTLPDSLLIVDEDDPETKRLKEDQAELLQIKNARPRLALAFEGNSQKLEADYSPGLALTKEEFINQNIATMKEQTPSMSAAMDGQRWATFFIPLAEINRFNEERDEWLHKCKKSLKFYYEVQELSSRSISFQLIFLNSGTSSANDITVRLQFPVLGKVFEALPEVGKLPPPPEQPSASHFGMSSSYLSRFLPEVRVPPVQTFQLPPNISKPTIENSGNGSTVEIHIQKAKHGITLPLPSFFFSYGNGEGSSFSFVYSILCAELPKPTEGTLNVVLVTI